MDRQLNSNPDHGPLKRSLYYQELEPPPGVWLLSTYHDESATTVCLARWTVGIQSTQRVFVFRGASNEIMPLVVPDKCTKLTVWVWQVANRKPTFGLCRPGLLTSLLWRLYARSAALLNLMSRPSAPIFVSKPKARLKEGFHVIGSPESLSNLAIVIPTRDRPDALLALFHTLLKPAAECGAEICLIDHASSNPEQASVIDQIGSIGAKILRDEDSFNYSRLINLGVRATHRPIVLTLNDDVSSVHISNLQILATLCQQRGNQILSPILLETDGSVQHAGIAIGLGGISGHIGRGIHGGTYERVRLLGEDIEVDAVTGAAMLFPRQVFDDLGGFDTKLPIEFNDIDFCLRAKAFGYGCLVTTQVSLVHAESSTRGSAPYRPSNRQMDLSRSRFFARWVPDFPSFSAYPTQYSLLDESITLKPNGWVGKILNYVHRRLSTRRRVSYLTPVSRPH
ncbi:glycosyltransferase [Aquidulcibacter sp.]|uniref:glycosyltransferase family 2 protein n=1 Tax=Aquidulcibacter sp. TaxID=2052990 RepID=UPI0025C2F46A|nr:glycosyltransferase [Aquidulcibacter sp.]MCA3695833.1 glycosyltransferase [Aquidulcibacter sp.]